MLKEVTTYLKPSSQCITQIKKEKKKKKETKNTGEGHTYLHKGFRFWKIIKSTWFKVTILTIESKEKKQNLPAAKCCHSKANREHENGKGESRQL